MTKRLKGSRELMRAAEFGKPTRCAIAYGSHEMEALMSDHGKCYRRRISDDGGEYLLMPRDDDFSDFPELTDVPIRIVLSIPLHLELTPVAESSTEVEDMVDAFFASIAIKGKNAL